MSERANECRGVGERMNAALRASERADERMAQYSTRRFHTITSHCASLGRSLTHQKKGVSEHLLASIGPEADESIFFHASNALWVEMV